MPESWLLHTANVLQICVPLMSLSGYWPQWQKLMRTQSSKDFSLRTWLIWTVSTLFALFYAVVQWRINHGVWPLLISASATLICVLITVCLLLKYRHPKK